MPLAKAYFSHARSQKIWSGGQRCWRWCKSGILCGPLVKKWICHRTNCTLAIIIFWIGYCPRNLFPKKKKSGSSPSLQYIFTHSAVHGPCNVTLSTTDWPAPLVHWPWEREKGDMTTTSDWKRTRQNRTGQDVDGGQGISISLFSPESFAVPEHSFLIMSAICSILCSISIKAGQVPLQCKLKRLWVLI